MEQRIKEAAIFTSIVAGGTAPVYVDLLTNASLAECAASGVAGALGGPAACIGASFAWERCSSFLSGIRPSIKLAAFTGSLGSALGAVIPPILVGEVNIVDSLVTAGVVGGFVTCASISVQVAAGDFNRN